MFTALMHINKSFRFVKHPLWISINSIISIIYLSKVAITVINHARYINYVLFSQLASLFLAIFAQ